MKMKLLLLISILSIIISTTLLIGSHRLETIKVGDKAPDFVLKDQDGKVHKLSDYRGQRVIVYYFPKADTPGWTKEACGFRDVYGEYKKAKIIVFGISYDSPKALKAFKDKYVLPFNFLSDKTKEVSKAYGAAGRVWPKRMTFIIDPMGKIEKIYEKVNVNTHAEKILDDLLAKK